MDSRKIIVEFPPKKHYAANCLIAAGILTVMANTAMAGEYDAVWRTTLVATAATVAYTNPMDADAVGAGLYYGEDRVPAAKLMARWPIKVLHEGEWLNIQLYHQLSYGRWQHPDDSSQASVNNVLAYNPVFRYSLTQYPDYFLETSIGVAVFSRSKFGEQNFGTNFQFSDLIALGLYFDSKHSWETSLQYQHYSNNSNTKINDGMDFIGLNLVYHYQ